jgi:hypothetical protein
MQLAVATRGAERETPPPCVASVEPWRLSRVTRTGNVIVTRYDVAAPSTSQ